MYQPEVYASLRERSPESFVIAEQLYDKVLIRNMLAVRALVTRARKDRMFEITQIEIIGLECNPALNHVSRILLRLSFRTEMDFQNNKIEFLETSLEISGPTYDKRHLEKEDLVNHVGTFVVEWGEKRLGVLAGEITRPWIDSSAGPFVGYYVLSDDVRTSVPAHHPLLLPSISTCLGSFHGTFEKKLNDVRNGQEEREKALCSFKSRCNSFVAQARRESARIYFGTFF